MAKQGRPRSARAASARIVHVKLRLYPGEDDDLIAFFEGIVPRLRAAMVKQALREGIRGPMGVSGADEETMDALDALIL